MNAIIAKNSKPRVARIGTILSLILSPQQTAFDGYKGTTEEQVKSLVDYLLTLKGS